MYSLVMGKLEHLASFLAETFRCLRTSHLMERASDLYPHAELFPSRTAWGHSTSIHAEFIYIRDQARSWRSKFGWECANIKYPNWTELYKILNATEGAATIDINVGLYGDPKTARLLFLIKSYIFYNVCQ